jgi:hypothetical protein
MSKQGRQTSKNQDFITTADLDENKIIAVPNNDQTIELAKDKWIEFLNDFRKPRVDWETKVEELNETDDRSPGRLVNRRYEFFGIIKESKK